MFRPILVATTVIGVAAPAMAETELETSGQVRIRDELRHELYSPANPGGDDTIELAHMRTRLGVDATIDATVGVVIELQDVRVLGSEGSTVADTEGVDLKRGYLELEQPGELPLTVQLGRYVMHYGDQRLIGHLEWVDQGRSYDGARVSYAPERGFVDAFAVRVRETLDAGDDLHFGGVYGGVEVGPEMIVEMYALGLRDAEEPQSAYGTFGARFAATSGPVDAAVELAAQVGEVADQDLVALAAAARAGYVLPGTQKVRIGGEVAYASGDDDPLDGDNGTFQTLFPTNHLHYGAADLAAWSNLLTLRAGVSLKPTQTSSVSLDFHHLRLADPSGGWFGASGALIRPGLPDADSDLGNEVDLVVGWKPYPALSLEAGAAMFLAGGFVSDTGGGGNALFGYLQVGAGF